MSLLDQLWDDTVAGPRPENGLGKLRKYSTFSSRPSSGKGIAGSENVSNARPSYGGEDASEAAAVKVTRSIMIVKPPGHLQTGSPPVSPAGSTPPVSPFSGGREPFGFRRKSLSDAYEKASEAAGPKNGPNSPYDV